jgi:hypothetical protein
VELADSTIGTAQLGGEQLDGVELAELRVLLEASTSEASAVAERQRCERGCQAVCVL